MIVKDLVRRKQGRRREDTANSRITERSIRGPGGRFIWASFIRLVLASFFLTKQPLFSPKRRRANRWHQEPIVLVCLLSNALGSSYSLVRDRSIAPVCGETCTQAIPAVMRSPPSRRRSSLVPPATAKPGTYRARPISFAPNVTPDSYDAPASDNESSFGDEDAPTLFPPSSDPIAPSRRRQKKKDPDHVPRPPNAFMLFRADFVRQRHVPGSIETNHGSLSKIIGDYTFPISIQDSMFMMCRQPMEVSSPIGKEALGAEGQARKASACEAIPKLQVQACAQPRWACQCTAEGQAGDTESYGGRALRGHCTAAPGREQGQRSRRKSRAA
ncbi:hypothetical protein BDZ89DRAFT_373389 [Hymenopellis radicata]|nr:hypothetical protein BDZ89DRAFT_373389 [Hymenopellis radicata]